MWFCWIVDPTSQAVSGTEQQLMLSSLRQVFAELLLSDHQKVLGAFFNEAEVPKSLHERGDSRSCRAHHHRQFFV